MLQEVSHERGILKQYATGKESTPDGENPACLNFLTCGKGVKCFLHPGHWELNAIRLWDLILTPVGTKSQSMQSTLWVKPYLRYGTALGFVPGGIRSANDRLNCFI